MIRHEHFQTGAMPPEIKVRDDAMLRTMEPEDAGRLMEIFEADPAIQDRVIWTSGLTDEALTSRMIAFRSRFTSMYSLTKDEKVAGYLGLWEDDEGYFDGIPHPGEYGFGYFIDPAERGNGLVTEAARVLMQAAEETFEVNNYAVYVEDNNPDSQAVLVRLGFKPDEGQAGLFKDPKTGVMERRWEKAPGE